MMPVLHVIGARVAQALATAAVLASLCFVFVHALPGYLALRVAAARVGDEPRDDGRELCVFAVEGVIDEAGVGLGIDSDRPAAHAQALAGEAIGHDREGILGALA